MKAGVLQSCDEFSSTAFGTYLRRWHVREASELLYPSVSLLCCSPGAFWGNYAGYLYNESSENKVSKSLPDEDYGNTKLRGSIPK